MEMIVGVNGETGYYLYKMLRKFKGQYFAYDCITDERVISEVRRLAIDCRVLYRKYNRLAYKPNKIYRIENNVYRTVGRLGEYNDFTIIYVNTKRKWTIVKDTSGYGRLVYLDKSEDYKNFYRVVEDDEDGYE